MSDHPRQNGKKMMEDSVVRWHLETGGHVHRVRADGNTYCEGGDANCALFGIQLREAIEAWS